MALTTEEFVPFKGGKIKIESRGSIYLADIKEVMVDEGKIKVTLRRGGGVQAHHATPKPAGSVGLVQLLAMYGFIERPLEGHRSTIGTRIVVNWPDREEEWTFFAPGDTPPLFGRTEGEQDDTGPLYQ